MSHIPLRRKVFPLFLLILGVLLLVGAGAWFFVIQPQSDQNLLALEVEVDFPYPEIQRVSLPEAKAAYDNQQAVFVDVRGAQYYQQSHISGALSLPEDQLPDRIEELDPQAWIITYCT